MQWLGNGLGCWYADGRRQRAEIVLGKGWDVSETNAELIAESRALSLGHLLAAMRLIPLGDTVQGCLRSDGQQTRDAVKASFRLNRKLADALESAVADAEAASRAAAATRSSGADVEKRYIAAHAAQDVHETIRARRDEIRAEGAES